MMPAPERILLVEDDPAIAAIITDILEDADYEVDGPHATLGDGMAAVAKHFPAGAVLDVRLGAGDVGLLADDLDSYDIPYLFCSGAVDPLMRRHARAPLVLKPALSRSLIQTLRSILH